jgi:myo-inositol-1-phosphate synthase
MRSEKVNGTATSGKLGVLVVGMGALSTTLIAGVLAVRRGLGRPVGSLTQMGRLTDSDASRHSVPISDAVPLAGLDDIVFGGWDILSSDAYASARQARVLDRDMLEQLRPELEAIRPWKGVLDKRYVRNIEADHAVSGERLTDAVRKIRDDVRSFQKTTGASRIVLLNCSSTETHSDLSEVHESVRAFEKGIESDHPMISPTMLYAWAAIKEGIPVVNCTPSRCTDIPAILELAEELHVPVAGRDLKTGQTLLKTILAPGLKVRALGLAGWYSTNILGNRDGAVLDDPEALRCKQESKLSVLNGILEPEKNQELYGNFVHKVRIDYYPPREDN